MQFWVRRAGTRRLDRVDWDDRPTGSGTPINRTDPDVEELVLRTRKDLKEHSDLGEWGAIAIHRDLLRKARGKHSQVPSVRTIGRILARHGLLDARIRQRRPAPPHGWFLPDLARRECELDSFDFIEDLKIRDGGFVNVLTGISLHGGLCAAWPTSVISSKFVVDALLEHWRRFGLPKYAKFDNASVFQGTHTYPDCFSRVVRVCLSLGVIPVFAPPREQGFQADIESFNGRWQSKVWRRFQFADLQAVQRQSVLFVTAKHEQSAVRIEAAPHRRPFPKQWRQNLQEKLQGTLVFIRRTTERGTVSVLGREYEVSAQWSRRLVRVELHLTDKRVRIYRLRRADPSTQPLLKTHPYQPPQKPFNE